MANAADRRRPQPARPAGRARAGFAYEGIGRPRRPTCSRAPSPRRELSCARWRRSSSPAARPSGSATPRAGGRRRSSRSPAGRSPPTRSAGSRAPASTRVIFAVRGRARASCSSASSPGLGAEIVAAEEPERLGRGGGIKFAARARRETGDVFALNGDELRRRRLRARCSRATARPGRRRRSRSRSRSRSSASSRSTTATSSAASRRPGASRTGSTAACYVLSEEAIERFPERGDHESTAFPELAAEGRLRAFRHEGCG